MDRVIAEETLAAQEAGDTPGGTASRGPGAPIGGAAEAAGSATAGAMSPAEIAAAARADRGSARDANSAKDVKDVKNADAKDAKDATAATAATLAAPPGAVATATAGAAPGSPAAMAAAALAAASAAAAGTPDTTETARSNAGTPLPPSPGGASAAAASGSASRHAGARAQGGPASLSAGGALAAGGEPAAPGAAPFPAVQADALRALGERLRSGADGGAEPAPTPTASVFQPLPAGVAAPRAEAAPDTQAPAGSYPITVPVQDPRFADAFSERVTWLVREGLQGAELTLNPKELGPIRIELALDGDAASIGVTAANAETRGAIEQALPRLREMLSSQGLQLGGAMVDAGSGRAPQGDGGRGRGPRADGRGGIVSLLGDGALATSAADPARTSRAGRVDVFA
ncbi:MAG: flagellar hook-length control protein FliK [Burkholderiales bacterium]|nr:MAG: flagellar hook-length control protein FliK [Burkholderiales bacterium]